jgi:hypothetical protein
MSRGVTSYGTPADRYQSNVPPVVPDRLDRVATGGNVPVGKGQNPTSAAMAGTASSSAGGAGFDYGQDPIQAALAAIGSLNFTPTPSYGAGVSSTDSLARRKYEDELAKEKRQIEAYQNMLASGGYRTGADRMLGLINQQGDVQRTNTEGAYRDALANILGGFTTAQDLTNQGYSGLEQFLRQNPNNPYAGVQVSAGQAPDAMEQILSAYGVSADPVRAQVAAEQAAAQQGAAGFQNLLNTLGASAQQSDASRLAEMMMARNLAGEQLSGQRAGLQSQAARAQADALAQIQAQLAQARLEQEAGVEQRRTGIEDLIAAAGGKIPETGAATGGGTEEAAKSRAIEQLAAKAGTVKDKKLAARIEAFVEANPNAGIAKIRKEFPALAKNLK